MNPARSTLEKNIGDLWSPIFFCDPCAENVCALYYRMWSMQPLFGPLPRVADKLDAAGEGLQENDGKTRFLVRDRDRRFSQAAAIGPCGLRNLLDDKGLRA